MQSELTVSSGWVRRVSRGAQLLVLIVLAGLFIAHIPRTTMIFLIGALLAFGVEPIEKPLEKHMPKAAAIAIVFLGLTLLNVIGLIIVVPLMVQQTEALGTNLPAYVAAVQQWIAGLQVWLQVHVPGVHLQPDSFDLNKVGSARLDAVAGASVASIRDVLVSWATAFFVTFSALVLSFFFLMNDAAISEGFVALFPERKRQMAQKLSAEIANTFGRYISGQVTVSGITAVSIAVLSWIAGFKLPAVLLIVTFIGYSIPMIGMILAHLIAAGLAAPQGASTVIWVEVIMFVVGRISDGVLVPKIMGQSMGISPIGVMFATFAGGELFGLPGLLFAIPLAALVKILWSYFGLEWWRTAFR